MKEFEQKRASARNPVAAAFFYILNALLALRESNDQSRWRTGEVRD